MNAWYVDAWGPPLCTGSYFSAGWLAIYHPVLYVAVILYTYNKTSHYSAASPDGFLLQKLAFTCIVGH